MYVEKYEREFQALLKDRDDNILAEGHGSVSEETDSVDFKSDFVPLYPIGTPLTIVRVCNNREIHIFEGEVYISDMNLLRLVAIKDTVVPNTEDIYVAPITLPAVFKGKGQAKQEKPKKFFLFRNNETPKPQNFNAIVNAISTTQMGFTVEPGMEIDDHFSVTLQTNPPLPSIPVRISRILEFGDANKGICEFEEMNPVLKGHLLDFVRETNIKGNRFFPEES